MAIDVTIPVILDTSADDYIAHYGAGTAIVYLEYGTATTPADGTAQATAVSGTERYEFSLTGVTSAYYYRYRVGDDSTFHDYSPVWQQPTSYATVQELVAGMDFPDESREDELERLLMDATDYITTFVCGGRSFFRDPVGSGESTLTLDVEWPGQSKLSLARGTGLDIVSLSSVGISDYTGQGTTTIANDATGYYTLPDAVVSGRPYTDLVLSDQGTTYTYWPTGRRVVTLTGVFGWSAVPDSVRRATVDLARAWWQRQPGDADPVGITAFGAPVFGPGTPKTVRDLQRSDYAWKKLVG